MSREDAVHAIRVLRLMPGDEVEAVSPPLRALASIVSTDAQAVTLRLVRLLPSSEMRTHLTLYQGLPKADKMEWIVQKGVELGCSRFVPIELARSVVQADPFSFFHSAVNLISGRLKRMAYIRFPFTDNSGADKYSAGI